LGLKPFGLQPDLEAAGLEGSEVTAARAGSNPSGQIWLVAEMSA